MLRQVFAVVARAATSTGVSNGHRGRPERPARGGSPRPVGKLRRLGIPTVRDRVVQAALKLVLEPIFEVDFKPCSYGFRPRRRAQDAIAEIHFLASAPRNYEWILEADIEACFDCIDHTALLGRVRRRIGDKRVLGLVKAFCKAGILTETASVSAAVQDTVRELRKAASSRRCWPTSRCPRWTSTSYRRGRRWATPAPDIGAAAAACRPIA